ncbi:MAG: MoaD/ThiS family protein [Chloroflexi bacterium]|nr:MoaD/ThiS family protein [Chloroflexota bacterium]
MNLTVKLFATLKNKAQASQLAQKPSLEPSIKSILVAFNHEFAFPDQILSPQDEIALFPPVSEG